MLVIKMSSTNDKNKNSIEYNVPKEYNTEHWNPDIFPIIILNTVFDNISVWSFFHAWTIYGHYNDKDTLSLILTMEERFSYMNNKMHKLQKYINKGKIPINDEILEMNNSFNKSLYRVNNSLQSIINRYNNSYDRTITLSSNIAPKYISSQINTVIFKTNRDDMIDLLNKLDTWIHRFNVNILPILIKK